MDVEDFDCDDWSRTQALMWMLFENDEHREDISHFLNHGSKDISPDFMKGSKEKVNLLDHLRTTHTWLRRSINLHPAVWMRLVFTTPSRHFQLSDRFLKAYSAWRHLKAQASGGINVSFSCQPPLCSGDTMTVSIDYFLHSTTLNFPFSQEIKIKLVGDLGEYADKSQKKNSRPTSEVVGRGSMTMIEDCIKDAIKKRTINSLKSVKNEERFVCSLTREKLAEALQARYKHTRSISVDTIVRGVGSFVRCSYRGP